MIEAKWPDANFTDKIGHGSIREYYQLEDGTNKEGALKIPPQIAARVNRGAMDKMAKAGQWAGVRYSKSGAINSPWWKPVNSIIKECKKIKWFDNHGEIKKSWKIFETRAAAWAAAGAAAGDAAWAAAGDAAWAAAWAAAGDAAWAAAGDAVRSAVWAAVRAAVRAAAGAAVWAAVRAAVRSAVWAAAGDAALMARMFVSNIPESSKHYKHAIERMEVWRSGYGLFCDVKGKLYVYKKI